jgi:rare lipoprotein A
MIVIGGAAALTGSSAHPTQKGSAQVRVLETQIGDATYYSSRFEGRKTASGRIFDGSQAIAAHRTYRFGTLVRVTNLRNKRSVKVVIVDRGPYGKNGHEGAIIDLSPAAARKIDIIKRGQARVKLEVLAWGNGKTLND